MARRVRACAATLMVAGAGLAGLGSAWHPAGPVVAGRPAWWTFPLLGACLVASAGLLLMLASGREDGGEGMLGGLLFGTHHAALLLAGGADVVLGVALLGADAGLVPDDARFVGLAASDWVLYAAASLVATLLAALGLCAWAWSAGRGTRARKAGAALHHVLAVALALAPWTIRAFFGA